MKKQAKIDFETLNTYMHNTPQICPCGKQTHLNKAYPEKGYTTYCSDACSKKYRTANREYNVLMSNYDWLYEQRFTLKKSKEQIAKDCGCSETVVNKWLKFHNLNKVKFNESDPEILEKLKNKDLIYDLHVIQKKSLREIAILLNSSLGAVFYWFKKHNIPANETNSYPRKHIYISKECQEVIDYIKTIYSGPIQYNVKDIADKTRDVDIYLPNEKIAIEYNGTYSHLYRENEEYYSLKKDETYHLSKTENCAKKGIELLHIFSYHWKKHRHIWESILQVKLNKIQNKIYAKNCTISKIKEVEAKTFLNSNHLWGHIKCDLNYGLFYNNELIFVMSFNKVNNTWFVPRFCTKSNCIVVGGLSKMISYFKNKNKENIIINIDRSFSTGNSLLKCNFRIKKQIAPNFYLLPEKDETMYYENEYSLKQNCRKIYNCGFTEFCYE